MMKSFKVAIFLLVPKLRLGTSSDMKKATAEGSPI
jgi:hypothetical protein